MRLLSRYLIGLAGCAALLFTLDALGLVGFTYPKAVDNQPLDAPVAVASVEGDTLILEDGRRVDFGDGSGLSYWIGDGGANLEEFFEGRPMEVQVTRLGDDMVRVDFKDRMFICGTPWVRVIEIELFPVSVPRYMKRNLGYGRCIPVGADE